MVFLGAFWGQVSCTVDAVTVIKDDKTVKHITGQNRRLIAYFFLGLRQKHLVQQMALHVRRPSEPGPSLGCAGVAQQTHGRRCEKMLLYKRYILRVAFYMSTNTHPHKHIP